MDLTRYKYIKKNAPPLMNKIKFIWEEFNIIILKALNFSPGLFA